MGSSNLAVLTKSHKIVAAKRRAKKEQIKEIVFDDTARREFLTGFHKRKVEKKEAAKQKALERERQERLEAKREKRHMLAERAAQNAAEAERAYGGTVGEQEADEQGEWDGISSSGSAHKGKGKQKEEEYEYEEQVATVTVVEDFDPDELIHGPPTHKEPPFTSYEDEAGDLADETTSHQPQIRGSQHSRPSVVKPSTTVARAKGKPKPKDIKYQTNAARKADKLKQRRRKVEKAERAGGKASRKSASGGSRHRR